MGLSCAKLRLTLASLLTEVKGLFDEELGELFEGDFAATYAVVDGGLCRGLRMLGPWSEDPHQHQRIISFLLCIRVVSVVISLI